MKYMLLFLLTMTLLFAAAPSVQAGYHMHKQLVTNESTVVNKSGKDQQRAYELLTQPFRNWQYRGWVSMVALLLGILGFVYPLFSVGAVLFGFMGMGRKNRHRGLAVAGLILGLTVLVLTIFFGFDPFPFY